jgi:hypothetical protein
VCASKPAFSSQRAATIKPTIKLEMPIGASGPRHALSRFPTKQSGNAGEAVFLPCEKLLKRGSSKVESDFNGEVAMNAIVAGVLAREAAKAQTEPHPLTLIALLCGVGLVAALTMASMGFDLGTGFF